MEFLQFLIFFIILVVKSVDCGNQFSRDDFPADFVFGSGTSAYQVEGAAAEDGRTPSIWDTFAHSGITHGANGDVACDHYHKYKEDVQLMVDTGLEAYRFSISWSRLIPNGRGLVNPKGLQYYNNLINELISHEIQPHVTLHHSDLPQALEDEYGGWLNRKIVYKFSFEKQHGFLGLNLFAYWFVPFRNTTEDAIATKRANDFYLGWFLNPLVSGEYPITMKKNAGSRMPDFTNLESKQIKGSFDFLGVNFYNTLYVKDNSDSLKKEHRDVDADMAVQLIPMLDNSSTVEFPVTPWGLQGVLEYFKQVYGNPPVYIHENGQRMQRNSTLEDWPRVMSLSGYIEGLLHSLRNGSNVRGYFTWSFLDLFEMLDGYESSYGLYYIDLDDPDLVRHPKLSA
ncbi:hypothetical protein Patl1_30172 [Pistacia atlantica]|uniref:Uncharacterized protein n=1 Tax=Pistacia atlantica TaxID=434234 RepID=A0ACC1AB89_9ROSI|nr:hypothetical protein Patl1_30172 [Pistacia atlantica]